MTNRIDENFQKFLNSFPQIKTPIEFKDPDGPEFGLGGPEEEEKNVLSEQLEHVLNNISSMSNEGLETLKGYTPEEVKEFLNQAKDCLPEMPESVTKAYNEASEALSSLGSTGGVQPQENNEEITQELAHVEQGE